MQHRIELPSAENHVTHQTEEFFYLLNGDHREKIRIQDYSRVFQVPGLYEQVVHDRLQCCSPATVVDVLAYAVDQSHGKLDGLKLLELGAGNGLVGEELKRRGAGSVIAGDINPAARDAAVRDRPGVYDAYHVMDFTNLSPEEHKLLQAERFDALICVSALGFAAPVDAFQEAFNLVAEDGWVAFNIKDTFLEPSDESGFSRWIRSLLFSEHFELFQLKKYRHRFTIGGEALHYYALAGKKRGHLPR